MKQTKRLILASQSPRRAEILKKAGYQFVSFPVYVSEIPNKNLSLDEQILDIARRKAEVAAAELRDKGLANDNDVILSADTLVCLDSKVLGKPDNAEMAHEFLSLLSGRPHQVKTAVILLDLSSGEQISHIETTQVIFRKLNEQEISDYISTKEPFDKAGGYGIQGEAKKFIEKFVGDYDNVVGLPLHAVENLFKLKGWEFPKSPQEI